MRAIASGPPASIPVTTPIYASTTFLYEDMAQLDRVMGREEEGLSYARYENPTNLALEELMTALENGHGALACASGMSAIHMAVLAALTDRPKAVLASNALYGASTALVDEGDRTPGRGSLVRGYLRSRGVGSEDCREQSPAAF